MTEQQELFRAPHEESRPKEEIPVKVTATHPTGSPATPPKKKHRVKDHDDLGAFVAHGFGRVMMLDSILVAVRLEDPFYDKPSDHYSGYPIEMSLAEYAKGEWLPPESPDHILEEYDRLSVIVSGEMAVERRCQKDYHRRHYLKLLEKAKEQLQAEIVRLRK